MAGERFKVGLTYAAKLTGKQRSTILRAIKAGRLSEHRDSHGRRRVDVAELERVYGPLRTPDAPSVPAVAPVAPAPPPADDRALVAELRAELERERDRAARLEADVREWQASYRKLAEQVLLTDQRPGRAPTSSTPAPPPRAEPQRTRTHADRTPEQAAGVVESVARGILGDDLPNLLFGRRRR